MDERHTELHDFPFYSEIPEVFIKGQEENGQWVVYLEASNELKDQDGETLEVAALQKARDYYLGHGILSWNHQHRISKKADPQYIIGEPDDVAFTSDNRTLVKGHLYQKNRIAQSVWDNIQSGAKRLGASVGGGILRKSNSRIMQVIWDETALTHCPVNDATYGKVQTVPFREFAKALSYGEFNADDPTSPLIKALMAGSGVDAGQFTGGRALGRESLQGAENAAKRYSIPKDHLQAVITDMAVEMIKGQITSYNDMLMHFKDAGYPDEVALNIANDVAAKFPSVAGRLRR